jgi:hypothetical protein
MALASQNLGRAALGADTQELFYTLEHIVPGIKRNAFLDSVASAIFLGEDIEDMFGTGIMRGAAKDTQAGGAKIHVNHELGKSPNHQTMASGWSQYQTARSDIVRRSEAEWRHHSDAVVISKTEELTNTGPEQIADILESRTRNAVSTTIEAATEQLYSGTALGATAFTGLNELISANDSVQGISGATYAEWNSWGLNAKRAAAASISFASGSFALQGISDMRTSYTNCTYGSKTPSVGLTTEAVRDFYEGSLVKFERYAAPAQTGDAGFRGVAYRTTPVYGDPLCIAGSLFWVDTECIRFICLAGADLQFDEFHKAERQEARASELMLKGNLVCYDRRRSNKLTGITA